jgi:choline dehydrogenase-like flavoprotein
MPITHSELRFKQLLAVWLVLFGGGVLVTTALAFLPADRPLLEREPLLVFVWLGQVVLFLACWYLANGIRDNELAAPVICWYKLIAGTAMLVLAAATTASATSAETFAVAGGGLLDYAQGGLTFSAWLSARRSRAQRLAFSLDVDPLVDEEPGDAAAGRLRIGLLVASLTAGAAAIGLFACWLSIAPGEAPAWQIAAGNACGAYAGLACAAVFAAETPRRREYLADIVLLALGIGAAGLIATVALGRTSGATTRWFEIAAAVHVVLFAALVALNHLAARSERPSRFFGPRIHQAFEAFAEVTVRGPVELQTARELADRADELAARTVSPRKTTVKLAAAAVEFGSLLLRGRPPMSRLGRLERSEYLRAVFERGRGTFRDIIKIKQLVLFLYYSDPAAYEAVGFVEVRRRRRFIEAERDGRLPSGPVTYPAPVTGSQLEADVCVIGSGAGGAVVARRLAATGARVVILEEGPYLKRDRITQDELDMQVLAYREGGLQSTVNLDLSLLQGRCVGGSTFLNNGILLELPPAVLREWRMLGVDVPSEATLARAYERVRRQIGTLHLADHQDLAPRATTKFVEGCAALGIEAQWFDVNLDDCFGCGSCTLGCAFELKQSTNQSYIPAALADGAVLVPDCRVERIESRAGVARTVHARRADGSRLSVRVGKVVVACGAVQSSLLLQRSGIKRNVGTRLSFNVGSWVFAEFDEPVDLFDGVQMCAYHETPQFFLETFATAPGAFAAQMPSWFEQHFHNMLRYRNWGLVGVLLGSQPVGRVGEAWLPPLRRVVSPIDFELPHRDLRRMTRGLTLASEVMLAAGARRVIPGTFNEYTFTDPGQLASLDELIAESDDVSLGSAHPQGGNPMSDDPALGAVGSDFRVHGHENLYVVDASVFPTSVMVNPQLSVMALAECAADGIADA